MKAITKEHITFMTTIGTEGLLKSVNQNLVKPVRLADFIKRLKKLVPDADKYMVSKNVYFLPKREACLLVGSYDEEKSKVIGYVYRQRADTLFQECTAYTEWFKRKPHPLLMNYIKDLHKGNI